MDDITEELKSEGIGFEQRRMSIKTSKCIIRFASIADPRYCRGYLADLRYGIPNDFLMSGESAITLQDVVDYVIAAAKGERNENKH